MHNDNRTISHYDKSRWLIGGELLTDPVTRDDQRGGDLINNSLSALPLTSVTGRLVGNYRFLLSRRNLGFGAGRRKHCRNPIMSHIKTKFGEMSLLLLLFNMSVES
jgi:hypothetical protein